MSRSGSARTLVNQICSDVGKPIFSARSLTESGMPPRKPRRRRALFQTPSLLRSAATSNATEARRYAINGGPGAAEQRVPMVVEIARIAREDFIRPLAVEHDLDAGARGQFHQVEPGNRRSRNDRLILEPQDLCQALPHPLWSQRDPL